MTQTEYSVDELLEFLDHAADRGLMPTPTAKALAVASRRVFGALSEDERGDLRAVDVNSAVKRFGNKHAKEFTPKSLREYGQRASRAVDQFLRWRNDPAGFSVKTRSTAASRKRSADVPNHPVDPLTGIDVSPAFGSISNTFQTSFPVRPGKVVTLVNVPADLSKAEAERLTQFIKMLVVD